MSHLSNIDVDQILDCFPSYLIEFIILYLPIENYDFLAIHFLKDDNRRAKFISKWMNESPHIEQSEVYYRREGKFMKSISIKQVIDKEREANVETYVLHSVCDLPAIIVYFIDKNDKNNNYDKGNEKKLIKIEEQYYYYGERHRDEKYGPAVIYYNKYGIKIREEYISNDKLHRISGPAVTEYFGYYASINDENFLDQSILCDNEKKYIEEFYYEGKKHRVTYENDITDEDLSEKNNYGPAAIEYDIFGSIVCKEYFNEDKRHRDVKYGAAIIHYNSKGKITFKEYWNNNKVIPISKVDRSYESYEK